MKLLCAEMALFSPVECHRRLDIYGVYRHGAVRVGLEATVSGVSRHKQEIEVILVMAGDGNLG